MNAFQMILIATFLNLLSGLAKAEPGCVIRLMEDNTCDSNFRIISGLDPDLNGCGNPLASFSEISGLYCRSPYSCFKDFPSSYKVGTETISWYNCYFGAEVIPPVSGPELITEQQDEGCVVRDVPDLNCPTGHRLYSQMDSRLNACSESVSDNAEIPGAFCKSRLKCYKDFRSVYHDNRTTYAWYNCQAGAFPIYGP